MAEGIYNSKDSSIKTAVIVNSGGQTLDLIGKGLWREIQIFQDIMHSSMSGTVLINDATDAFSTYYLCGNEYIQLEITQPGLTSPLKKTFRIYKVSDRKLNTDSAQMYLLHFCSEEAILSQQLQLSKSYKTKRIRDIIENILVDRLKVPSNRFNLEPTMGTYDIVIPYYQPFEAIQWLTSRAYNTNKFCYFFYEDINGYNLASLQSLYSKKIRKEKIRYELKNVRPDPADNKDSIDKFTIMNDFDMFTTISNGGFASRLLGVDVFHQSFNFYDYSLAKAESQKNLLNRYKPMNDLVNAKNQSLTQSPYSLFKTYIEVKNTQTERSNDIKEWYLPRAMHMTMLEHFKIKAVLPGDILLKAGELVDFEFPNFVSANKGGKEFDKHRSGKYLIKAINHKFMASPESFESTVELVSDSFSESVPSPKSNLYNSLRVR